MMPRDRDDRYTAKRVMAITGVAYQTLNLWAKTGLISPSIEAADGRGSERVYSFRDLVALRVAVSLREQGVSTRSLERVVRFLQLEAHYDSPLSEVRLIVTADDVVEVKSGEELISTLKKPGQSYLAFVVDFPRAVVDLEKATNAAAA
jgi:DNA-binding transcriptional MerR regulator